MAQTADVDTPFELTFLSYSSGELLVEAELTSPMLDPTLHPTGSLRVKINTDPVTLKPKTKFLLNSFHMNSLTEFLRMQPLVRSTLEAELPRDRANWQKTKECRRGRGHPESREGGLPGGAAAPDSKATRTGRAEDHPGKLRHRRRPLRFPRRDAAGTAGDHLLLIQFRDGKAVGLQLEG